MKPTDTNHVCLVCGKNIENIYLDGGKFHPTQGCISGSHIIVESEYGSVFDCLNSNYLSGAICNDCLEERIGRLFLISQKAFVPDDVIDNIYEKE